MTDAAPRARRSDATRAAILRAARERFAADGYERATIRAIAADARIDPSMVMRYYGSKEGLFAAAAEFDLRLPDLADVPAEQLGEVLVRHFLDRWEGDETLAALLRTASTNQGAAERMRGIFADQLGAAVARFGTDPATAARARRPGGQPDPRPGLHPVHRRACRRWWTRRRTSWWPGSPRPSSAT